MIRSAIVAALLGALSLGAQAQTTSQGSLAKPAAKPAPQQAQPPRPESDSDRFRRQLRVEEDTKNELRPLAPKPKPGAKK